MIIDTNKKTNPKEPYFSVLFIEQQESVIGCVQDTRFSCAACQLRKMCKVKDDRIRVEG
jgi:hypothetical protein